MPKISVIVPVYKVEKYIHKCVDSILNQTFSDIEVILVDDGTPDRCGEICDAYGEQDSRVKVIHKENGGLSDAKECRNATCVRGIYHFYRQYDYIESDMLEYMYTRLTEAGADMATCGSTRFTVTVLNNRKRKKILCVVGKRHFDVFCRGTQFAEKFGIN